LHSGIQKYRLVEATKATSFKKRKKHGVTRGEFSSSSCVAIATHEFLKKVEIFFLTIEFSVANSD
jgi:hypothetical protein